MLNYFFDLNRWGVDMRYFAMGTTGAIVFLLAGILAPNVLAPNAEATMLTSAATVSPATNYSLVQKAGCGAFKGLGKCPGGSRHVKDTQGLSHCVSCDIGCRVRCRKGKILMCDYGVCHCRKCRPPKASANG